MQSASLQRHRDSFLALSGLGPTSTVVDLSDEGEQAQADDMDDWSLERYDPPEIATRHSLHFPRLFQDYNFQDSDNIYPTRIPSSSLTSSPLSLTTNSGSGPLTQWPFHNNSTNLSGGTHIDPEASTYHFENIWDGGISPERYVTSDQPFYREAVARPYGIPTSRKQIDPGLDTLSLPAGANRRAKRASKYVCSQCGASFTTRYNMKRTSS